MSALSQNQFGRATTDVHHQPRVLDTGHRVGNTGVHQPGFFMPGQHVDPKPQVPFGTGQEQLGIRRFAHGTGRHRPHPSGFKATQFFAESGESLPTPIQRQLVQRPGLQALGQSDRLTQGLHFLDHQLSIALDRLANHQAEVVRAQVNGREQGGVAFHSGVP
ncbi:hypothetical protein D9M68_848450 [compost metagenome]